MLWKQVKNLWILELLFVSSVKDQKGSTVYLLYFFFTSSFKFILFNFDAWSNTHIVKEASIFQFLAFTVKNLQIWFVEILRKTSLILSVGIDESNLGLLLGLHFALRNKFIEISLLLYKHRAYLIKKYKIFVFKRLN